jgi:hypothetical protein
MYVHGGDTFVNLSAYVCDYSWGAHKMYALYIVLNWSVTHRHMTYDIIFASGLEPLSNLHVLPYHLVLLHAHRPNHIGSDKTPMIHTQGMGSV